MLTVLLAVLLGIVCFGFAVFTWSGTQHWGPEGPVGAWLIPVPFLMLLLGILLFTIVAGKFDWVPGGKVIAFLLMIGYMTAVTAALFGSFGEKDSVRDLLLVSIPFVAVAGIFCAISGVGEDQSAALVRMFGVSILGVTSVGGWGFLAYAGVNHMRSEFEQAERAARQDAAEDAAFAERRRNEWKALPADAPFGAIVDFVFAEDPQVQREARARIAAWPNLDAELNAVLLDEHTDDARLSRVVSYIAMVHTNPTAVLAPGYAHALERAYTDYGARMRVYDDPERYEATVSVYFDGAERIQKAGGNFKPQLDRWYELVKPMPTVRMLKGQINRLRKASS